MNNCYNRGTISNLNDDAYKTVYVGGLTSVVSLSTGQSYEVANCYNTGEIIVNISNEETKIYAGNIIGEHRSGTIKNCYYEKNEIEGIGIHNTEDCVDDITQMDSPNMKTQEFVEKLNKEDFRYYYDKQNINNGYPILKLQYIELLVKQIQPNTTLNNIRLKLGGNEEEINVYNKNKEIIAENEFVGTGMTLELIENGNKITFTLVVLGDVNGDGEAKLSDMTVMNKCRLNRITLYGEYLLAADVIEDGQINIQDIVKINRYRLHKIQEL